MRDRAVSDPQILFLKGYPSPEWVKSIGGCCRVDPEFFRWQLRFRCRREYSSSPSLPSAFENIVRLRFTTIGETNSNARNQSFVEKLREIGAEGLSKYKHTLKVGSLVRKGDSIVRDYFVLDARHFIIEQEMSICVQPLENSWIGKFDLSTDTSIQTLTFVAIVCSDAGSDLSLGPPGPWMNIGDRKYSSSTMIYPTIQHLSRGFSRANSTPKTDPNADHGAHFQSASLLPEQFGATLDISTMRANPFYALTELFRFSAFSENQFLNLMEQKIIPDAGYQSLKQETPTLSNLLYFQEILETHMVRLKDTVKVIRGRGSHWASSCEKVTPVGSLSTSQRTKSDTAASMLLEDFEHLLERAEALKRRCDQGMAVIMNNAILAESKRAISQAKGVAKLTLVAFFYIPFSFTTSFFGMNFRELGTGKLSVGVWFATSIPIFLITLTFLLLDGSTFRSIASKLGCWFRSQIGLKSRSSKGVGIAA